MAPKKKTKKTTSKKSTAKKPAKKKQPTKKASAKTAKKKRPGTTTTKKKKKPAGKRAPAKTATAKRKPLVRRDATGHLNPTYERDLRRSSRENAEHDDDRGFLVGKNRDEALAEELGREFVETVTSGEDEGVELRDQFLSEEVGGPFVETTRGQEVADEPDESNPIGATREPFPKT
jgi:hypothetical protein